MGTRCNIGYRLPNGNVKSVYCQFDGYPQHTGKTLLQNYTKQSKIEDLIDGGDMSGLESTIAATRFYKDSPAEEVSLSAFKQNSYAYYWDNGWYWSSDALKGKYKLLTPSDCEDTTTERRQVNRNSIKENQLNRLIKQIIKEETEKPSLQQIEKDYAKLNTFYSFSSIVHDIAQYTSEVKVFEKEMWALFNKIRNTIDTHK